MSKSVHRYLFWDGSRNCHVRRHELDTAITCQGAYVTSSGPAIPRAMPTISVSLATRKEVTKKVATWGLPSGVGVRVKKVDEWFVPLEELLAIHIALKEASQIRSLALIVYDRQGEPVYFERLDAAAIGKLPEKDESVDGDGKKKPFPAKGRERADQGTPGERFTVRVWVSTDSRAFTDVHPGAIPPMRPASATEPPEFGKWTVTSACDYETLTFASKSRMPPANITRLSLDELRATEFYRFWKPLLTGPPAGGQPAQPVPDDELREWGAWFWRKEAKYGRDQLGRNVTAASTVIETILAKSTKITIEDKAPAGDKLGLKGEKESKGESFPEFRDMIKRLMYEACAHTSLGMALLDNVAQGPHPVTLHPVTAEFYNEIGGTAYTPELNDDHAVSRKVEEIRDKISKKKWAELAAMQPWEGQLTEAKFFTTGAIKRPKKNVIAFAARRFVYCEMGASSRKGCASRFYFGVQYMKTVFGGDRYEVKQHVELSRGECQVKVRPDEPGQPGETYDAPTVRALQKFYYFGKDSLNQDRWVAIDVETPLFLAFLHELIHARRFQLGLNAEWDEIMTSQEVHPDALMEQLRTGGVAEDVRKNIAFRYSGTEGKTVSREEFDTVEGYGAPVEVPAGTIADRIAGVRKARGAAGKSILYLTENALRVELGLDFRARYLSCRVSDRDGDRVRADPDEPTRIPRKYRPVRLDSFELAAQPFKAITLADLKGRVEGTLGAGAGFDYKPGENVFMFGRQRMGAAYAFKNMCSVSIDELGEELANLKATFTAIKNRARYIKQDLSEMAQALFTFSPDSKEDFPDPPAKGESLPDYQAKMQRLVGKVFCGLLGLETDDDWQIVVSQGSDELARLMANGEGVEAFCALSHKAINPDADMGPGKPVLGTLASKLAFVYNTAPRREINAIHLFIHEPMHISSFKTQGFRIWPIDTTPPACLQPVLDDLKREADRGWDEDLTNLRDSVMDEGTTELLARVITYRTNVKLGRIVSEVELFGGIPSYEYSVRFVVELLKLMAAGLGDGKKAVELLIDAYARGKFSEFDAGFQTAFSKAPWDKPKLLKLFAPATHMRKETIYYLSATPPSAAVDSLKKDLGFAWPSGTDLVEEIVAGRYRDPVITELGGFFDALHPGEPKIADYYTKSFKPDEKPHFAHALGH